MGKWSPGSQSSEVIFLVCLFYVSHQLILHYKFVILPLGWGQCQYFQGNLELCDFLGGVELVGPLFLPPFDLRMSSI